MRRNTSTRLKLCEVSSATHTRALSQGPTVHFAAHLVSVHFTLQREFRKLHSADGSVHFALNYIFAKSQALFAQPTPRLLDGRRLLRDTYLTRIFRIIFL